MRTAVSAAGSTRTRRRREACDVMAYQQGSSKHHGWLWFACMNYCALWLQNGSGSREGWARSSISGVVQLHRARGVGAPSAMRVCSVTTMGRLRTISKYCISCASIHTRNGATKREIDHSWRARRMHKSCDCTAALRYAKRERRGAGDRGGGCSARVGLCSPCPTCVDGDRWS